MATPQQPRFLQRRHQRIPDRRQHHEAIEEWWTVARDDFASLRDDKKMPEVRHELLTTITRITLALINRFPIAVPPIHEQSKIAGILSTVDRAKQWLKEHGQILEEDI